jgi:cytochrome c-type biogenesis protein CcmH/NrfG
VSSDTTAAAAAAAEKRACPMPPAPVTTVSLVEQAQMLSQRKENPDVDGAIACLRVAVRADPSFAYGWFNLGYVGWTTARRRQ